MVDYANLNRRNSTKLAQQFSNLGCKRPSLEQFIIWMVKRGNQGWICLYFFRGAPFLAFTLDLVSWFPA